MSAIIGLSGSRIDRFINTSDIEHLKGAKNRNDIASLWGKIADWFCGTNKEEAKRALFDMFNSDIPSQKIEYFNHLKDMVSPAYTGHFTSEITESTDKFFTITLSIIGVLEPTKLTIQKSRIDNIFKKEFLNAEICLQRTLQLLDACESLLPPPDVDNYRLKANKFCGSIDFTQETEFSLTKKSMKMAIYSKRLEVKILKHLNKENIESLSKTMSPAILIKALPTIDLQLLEEYTSLGMPEINAITTILMKNKEKIERLKTLQKNEIELASNIMFPFFKDLIEYANKSKEQQNEISKFFCEAFRFDTNSSGCDQLRVNITYLLMPIENIINDLNSRRNEVDKNSVLHATINKSINKSETLKLSKTNIVVLEDDIDLKATSFKPENYSTIRKEYLDSYTSISDIILFTKKKMFVFNHLGLIIDSMIKHYSHENKPTSVGNLLRREARDFLQSESDFRKIKILEEARNKIIKSESSLEINRAIQQITEHATFKSKSSQAILKIINKLFLPLI